MQLWPFDPDCAWLNVQENGLALDCTWHTQKLGKQMLICIESEAPITTSVLPQRPQWGKQEASRPLHWASSILPSLPPLPLSVPQKRAVLEHTAAGDKTCALVNTQESKQPRMSHLLTCHRMNAIKLLFLCSLYARVSLAHLLCCWARMTTSVLPPGY